MGEVDRLLGVVLAEQVGRLALVAGRDELLQPQLLEVVGEVVEEVAHRGGRSAVAIDDLALEAALVVAQLALDVRRISAPQAREYADGTSRRMVLINGRQLAELMIDHGVGITVEHSYEVPRLDLDYFVEDEDSVPATPKPSQPTEHE